MISGNSICGIASHPRCLHSESLFLVWLYAGIAAIPGHGSHRFPDECRKVEEYQFSFSLFSLIFICSYSAKLTIVYFVFVKPRLLICYGYCSSCLIHDCCLHHNCSFSTPGLIQDKTKLLLTLTSFAINVDILTLRTNVVLKEVNQCYLDNIQCLRK